MLRDKIYKCPICHSALFMTDKVYKCCNGHSYDIASSGYLHLLMSNKMNSKLPGDNKEMVNARKAFLSCGYYETLSDKVNQIIYDLIEGKEKAIILDSGSGEGYYTNRLYESLNNRITLDIVGFDISKIAVTFAAKRNRNIDYIVASVNDIPLLDNTTDCIINIFSPIEMKEYNRISKAGGYLLLVLPGEKHLEGLKKIIYDKPYVNEVKNFINPYYQIIDRVSLTYDIVVSNKESIMNLFMMTPYYYNTAPEDYNKLLNVMTLNTLIDFDIVIMKKGSNNDN